MKRLPLIFFCVLISVSLLLAPIYAAEAQPKIEVWPPPTRRGPVKVYVTPSTCEYGDRIAAIFYEVVRELPKSILRFVDEHPEYRRLLEISFVNASDMKTADIVLEVDENLNHSRAEVTYGGNGKGLPPYKLEIACIEGDLSETRLHNIVLHELLHTLGVGHTVNVFWTSRNEPEVMLNIDGQIRQYPTTLDLYALYETWFGKLSYREDHVYVALPAEIEYEMSIPYQVEVAELKGQVEELQAENRKLADENQKLWSGLKTLHGVVDQKNAEIQKLKDVNKALQQNVTFLLELVKDYGEQNHRLQAENQRLKANLSRLYMNFTALIKACNRSYYEWARRYNQTFDQLVNMTGRYNHCVALYNQISADYRETTWKHVAIIYSLTGLGVAGWVLWLRERLKRIDAEAD